MNYGAMTVANRLKRVMFAYGYTEAEARAFIRGWVKGRRAKIQADRRGEKLACRVGGPQWERTA